MWLYKSILRLIPVALLFFSTSQKVLADGVPSELFGHKVGAPCEIAGEQPQIVLEGDPRVRIWCTWATKKIDYVEVALNSITFEELVSRTKKQIGAEPTENAKKVLGCPKTLIKIMGLSQKKTTPDPDKYHFVGNTVWRAGTKYLSITNRENWGCYDYSHLVSIVVGDSSIREENNSRAREKKEKEKEKTLNKLFN